MAEFLSSPSQNEPAPPVFARSASIGRTARWLAYALVAVASAVLLGSVVPLGTWLLLCAAVAVPTVASVLVVASE